MQETKTTTPTVARWLRWFWIVLSVGVLLGVMAYVFDIEDIAEVAARDEAPPVPGISVVTVAAGSARAEVSVFAELRPQWDAKIRAAVSGRVVRVHTSALAGTQVPEGAPLFSIERTQYETAVAEAEMNLEQARLAMLQAENQVTVARRQFQRDNAEPPNELALYLPQLRIAKRSMASAKARVEAALRQLAYTEVKAPFSGFVTSRAASLGQTVTAGEALLHLSDDRQFELVAELSQAEWALLDHPISGTSAQLFHRDGRHLGAASIRQGGGFLDPRTRQMRVFLEVSDPGDDILSGDFIRVAFDGRQIGNTLTMPETALTRAGNIWFVSAQGFLERVQPKILFRTGDMITVAAPEGSGPWQVAVTPLASFLPGQRVTPKEAEG